MADPISVRPYQDHDLPAVLEVLRRALGETPLLKRTPELFSWKHFDNPYGRSIILLAESNGRIAGVRAFMRWELATPTGHVVRCVRAVDTATDPDFQRRGVFRLLTTEAVEVARSEGVELILNTPNPRSGAGYLTMGWQEVGPIGVLARPRLRYLGRRASGEEVPRPEDILPGALPVSVPTFAPRPPRGLRTVRTEAYLRWRFTQHPTARYVQMEREGGIAILRPNLRAGRTEVVVSDLFGPNPSAAVSAAARLARASYLVSWASRGSPERSALIRGGLLPVPRLQVLTLMARPLVDLGLDVANPDAWDFCLSDLELL